MSNNNDLEMQTFEIYPDEDTPAPSKEEPVKTVKATKDASSKLKSKAPSSGSSSDVIKGVLLGLVVIVAFIAFDMIRK